MSKELGLAVLQEGYAGARIPVMEHLMPLSREAIIHFSGIDPVVEPNKVNDAFRIVAELFEQDLNWGVGLPVDGMPIYDWSDGATVKLDAAGNEVVQWGVFGTLHQEGGRHLVILHDDLSTSRGPIFSPPWYRRHVFPYYPSIFAPLRAKGIPVIFTSDGNCTEFVDDIFTAGADGLNFEHLVDLGMLVEKHPDKILIGNIRSSTLARGTREDIESETRRCMETGGRARRFVVNVAGGLTHDIPIESLECYLNCRKNLARTLRTR